ncbi:nitroreductase family protein [Clostridium grantii]|uniref:Nitroreductase n=1 Tax=Clostridium grantii DSM 8605 TaxID=1121316 RepID=A0A1M5V356_9CLOT|nr:nitroreductase family protein [Clostridium grantii]SHH69610.1 Nitroreductase [Clostridium grantii DSM 8605]
MNFIDRVNTRKSVRKYKEGSIEQEDLKKIDSIIDEVKPLDESISFKAKLVNYNQMKETFKGIKNMYFKVKAPHYIILTSEIKDGYKENIGFVGEQIVLQLTNLGVGSCWLGSPIDENILRNIIEMDDNQRYIIMIALGYPLEKLSVVEQRKRISMKELMLEEKNTEHEFIFKALLSAPSAVNSQPWRINFIDNRIDFYKKNNFITNKLLGKYGELDMGIGLSHIYFASKEFGYSPKIINSNETKKFKDTEYFFSVQL